MTATPATIKRAAAMTVIQCHNESGDYHVITPEKRVHDVTISVIGGTLCDCEAGMRGAQCAHCLAVKWFREYPQPNKEEG